MLVASDFAARLKELREAAAMSQYALAKAAGISKQAISMLEKGSNEPSWDTVRKIARALGISVADFDADEGNATAPEPDDEPPTPSAKKPAPKKPKG